MAALKGVSDWDAMWAAADDDGNGFLTLHELAAMLRANGSHCNDKEVCQIFMTLNEVGQGDDHKAIVEMMKDPDKKVTKDKFIAGMTHLQGCLKTADALFDKFDADKSGFLEKREVMEVCKAAFKMSDRDAREKADELLNQNDRDHDGRMSKTELMNSLA